VAHGRGKRLVVDMIGTRDRAKRAYEMKDLGVDNSPRGCCAAFVIAHLKKPPG